MSELTEEQIEYVLASDKGNAELARELDSHHLTIKKIRKDHENAMQKGLRNEEKQGQGRTQEVEQTKNVVGIPQYGYRDGEGGTVERCLFQNGRAKGWLDRPGKCKNCPKDGHPEYADVKA